MNKKIFGKLPTGEEIYIYSLTDGDSKAEIITYGARIVSLYPFGDTDVVGGFDTLDDYITDTSYQGATVGRVANRIADACFEIDGENYTLPKNDNQNCLHGGIGFSHKVWTVEEYEENRIKLSYHSPDMENGFPSNLDVTVTYTLTNSTIQIDYKAIPDGKTPIALTNHSYFNLDGFGKDYGTHKFQIFADRYTDVDDNLIPNGNRPLVDSTPFDLRTLKCIVNETGDFFNYDHNMILSPKTFKSFNGISLGLVATVENDNIIFNTYTDQPGIQFYTGNFLGYGPNFKNNTPQIPHGAFCLETQTEPNCIKKGIGIYDKGECYTQHTVYEFKKK